MMDFEKLIEAVRLCGSTPKADQCKQCAYWSGGDMSKCIPRMTTDAATALSTLQAENEKLRAELENYRNSHCADGGCAAEKDRDLVIAENKRLWAELEQVKRERDAAVKVIERVRSCKDCWHYTGEWTPPCKEKQKQLCPVGLYGRHYVYGSDREKYNNWEEIIDALENMPAADVAPVVRGRWIFNDDWWEFRCTNCHKSIGNIEKYKYCLHCGARMDGTEGNG